MGKIAKLLSLLAFMLIPLHALGVNGYPMTQPSGSGTQGSPYLIATMANLTWVMENPSEWVAGKYFTVTADIDASVTSTWTTNVNGFRGIGTSQNQFNGVFDGGGHTISGIHINRPNDDYIGFFGYVGAGEIKNLKLTSLNVTGHNDVGGLAGYISTGNVTSCEISGSVTGNNYVGGLASNVGILTKNCKTSGAVTGVVEVGGISANMGGGTKLENCSSSMTVTATGQYAGGLVGYGCEMADCYFTGTVTGTDTVGGIVGYHDCDEGIYRTYSTGTVTGVNKVGGIMGEGNGPLWETFSTGKVTGTGVKVGGLAGINYRGIEDSFATGEVTGTSEVGGLVGYTWGGTAQASAVGNVINCYSTGKVTGADQATTGGLIGKYYDLNGTTAVVTSSYWDTQKSLQATSPGGGTGKTTAQLMEQATFTGWDFTNTWRIQAGKTTPFFSWQDMPDDVTVTEDTKNGGGCFLKTLGAGQ